MCLWGHFSLNLSFSLLNHPSTDPLVISWQVFHWVKNATVNLRSLQFGFWTTPHLMAGPPLSGECYSQSQISIQTAKIDCRVKECQEMEIFWGTVSTFVSGQAHHWVANATTKILRFSSIIFTHTSEFLFITQETSPQNIPFVRPSDITIVLDKLNRS